MSSRIGKRSDARGVTLIEVGIAAAIGTMLMLAMLRFMGFIGKKTIQADTRLNSQSDLHMLTTRVAATFRHRMAAIVPGDPSLSMQLIPSAGLSTACHDALFRTRHFNKGVPYIETVKVRTVC